MSRNSREQTSHAFAMLNEFQCPISTIDQHSVFHWLQNIPSLSAVGSNLLEAKNRILALCHACGNETIFVRARRTSSAHIFTESYVLSPTSGEFAHIRLVSVSFTIL